MIAVAVSFLLLARAVHESRESSRYAAKVPDRRGNP